MSVTCRSATADVLLLYPGDSLRDQIGLWAVRHPEQRVAVSFERSLPKMRRLLNRVGATLVDATKDPSMAADAFLQAAARLGAGAVAVYTEVRHDDIELFVRLRGAPFLLGPLFDQQWEDHLDSLFHASRRSPIVRALPPQRLSALHDVSSKGT